MVLKTFSSALRTVCDPTETMYGMWAINWLRMLLASEWCWTNMEKNKVQYNSSTHAMLNETSLLHGTLRFPYMSNLYVYQTINICSWHVNFKR